MTDLASRPDAEDRRPPSRAQIALLDMEALRDLEAHLDQTIAKIETDLEFGDGDEMWAGRARAALAHHKAARLAVQRRLNDLGGASVADATDLERLRLKNEDLARKLEAQRLDLIKRTSWLGAFAREARGRLSPEVFDGLTTAADLRYAAKIAEEVEKGRAA